MENEQISSNFLNTTVTEPRTLKHLFGGNITDEEIAIITNGENKRRGYSALLQSSHLLSWDEILKRLESDRESSLYKNASAIFEELKQIFSRLKQPKQKK